MTIVEANVAMRKLLLATIEQESLISARDKEVAKVQDRYAPKLNKAGIEAATLESDLETFYRANPPSDGSKHLQLANGLLGLRSAANPALIPLNEKWTWPKITATLKELFKAQFFHKPKAPAIDKVKVKRELTPAQLEKCGLKLDTTENFYIDLNRLENAA